MTAPASRGATAQDVLPVPASTYQLVLDAAARWPDAPATRWIPDPADHTRSLTWTYAELAPGSRGSQTP